KEEVYAFCSSIVQSSGMGKSRLVAKMGEEHVVIPCCLRKAKTGYPPPDHQARDFLTKMTKKNDDYNLRVQAFLMALFLNLHQILAAQYDATSPGENAIATFVCRLFEEGGSEMDHGDERKGFYEKVVNLAEDILEKGEEKHVEAQVRAAPNATSPKRITKTLPDTITIIQDAQLLSAKDLPQITVNLLDYLSKLFGKQEKGPLLVLSWDEAHVLTRRRFGTRQQSSQWTYFNEFRRVLRDCDRSGRLFSLFLSTTGKIDQFSPNSRDDPSARIGERVLKVPYPFINLGFDQFARGQVQPNKGFKLSEAVKPEWIVKFGRPLWSTRYQYGNKRVRDCIFDFAMIKLLNTQHINKDFRPTRQDILAIMGLRLGLKLDAQNRPDADVAKQLVERHMRVVMQVTADSNTIKTLAPSEPVLAEASIRAMRVLGDKFRPAEALHQVLGDSLHAKGERGEFIAALLLLLARDEVAKETKSAKIRVTDFLVKLLGEGVLEFLPNASRNSTNLKAAFKDAYVHFTHT
ncbi:10920_t:CDS:2, partial [Acaulospora colombiana]